MSELCGHTPIVRALARRAPARSQFLCHVERSRNISDEFSGGWPLKDELNFRFAQNDIGKDGFPVAEVILQFAGIVYRSSLEHVAIGVRLRMVFLIALASTFLA